ncbi:hypothetical protein ACLOJK_034827 [Asimina triloba]
MLWVVGHTAIGKLSPAIDAVADVDADGGLAGWQELAAIGDGDRGVGSVVCWWPDLAGRGERRATVSETRRRTAWQLLAEALSSAMDKAGAGSILQTDGGGAALAVDESGGQGRRAVETRLSAADLPWKLSAMELGEDDDGAPYWCSVLLRGTVNGVPADQRKNLHTHTTGGMRSLSLEIYILESDFQLLIQKF